MNWLKQKQNIIAVLIALLVIVSASLTLWNMSKLKEQKQEVIFLTCSNVEISNMDECIDNLNLLIEESGGFKNFVELVQKNKDQ